MLSWGLSRARDSSAAKRALSISVLAGVGGPRLLTPGDHVGLEVHHYCCSCICCHIRNFPELSVRVTPAYHQGWKSGHYYKKCRKQPGSHHSPGWSLVALQWLLYPFLMSYYLAALSWRHVRSTMDTLQAGHRRDAFQWASLWFWNGLSPALAAADSEEQRADFYSLCFFFWDKTSLCCPS